MMRFKTQIKESTIPGAGLGCFAAELIPENAILWIFDPNLDRKFSQEEIDMLTDFDKDFVEKYSYRHNGSYYLCMDGGRYINHSDEPNTKEFPDIQVTIATRDIQVGEEILSNYRHFGITEEDYTFNMIL